MVDDDDDDLDDKYSVEALFNGQRDFCYTLSPKQEIPAGCFTVRMTRHELSAIQSGEAIIEWVWDRWQIVYKKNDPEDYQPCTTNYIM
jgi:hypothetical protein